MYTIITLLFLSTFGCVLTRPTAQDDVIWFPIDGYNKGYSSSYGEVFLSNDPYFQNNYLERYLSRRRFRSVPEYSELNDFESERRNTRQDDAIVFPGQVARRQEQQDDGQLCMSSCPWTPEYNPVCGSDGVNYHNTGQLKCSQFCGNDVKLAHLGVCGKGLPLIFRPSPRPPGRFQGLGVN